MDSRSKYAALPFVAIGEKDLYETDDLPEADQIPSRDHPWDASVEIIPCGTIEAFKRFASSDVNHTESESPKESLYERFERLKCDAEELIEYASKDTNKEDKELVLKVEQLSSHLQQLHVSRFENAKMLERVYDHLKTPNVTTVGKDKGKDVGKDVKSNEITYQLWYRPELTQINDSSKFNALEQRIKRIETMLGTNDQKLSLLTSFTNDRNLMDAVQVLSGKVSQLDPSHLEKIDARLHMITDKLSQISERKSQIEDLEKHSKVTELHDIIFKSDKCRASIPRLIERLETLNDLHEQAIQFSSALSYLDSLQSQISDNLQNNDKQLKSFKESFEKNVDSIKSIIGDFDKRINALK